MKKLVCLLIILFSLSIAFGQQDDKVIELKKKIEEEKKAIESLSKTEKRLTLTIAEINARIKSLKKRIGETEKTRQKLQSELKHLYSENEKLNIEISSKREEIEKRLLIWHKTYLLKPAYSFVADIKHPIIFDNYMRYIFRYDRALFSKLKETQEELMQNLERINKKKNEIALIEKELVQKKQEQEELERLQKERLTTTKKEKAAHARSLKEAEIALKRLEQIFKKAEQIPEYTGKGLSRGVLPYPVAGEIVGHFGKEEGMAKGSLFTRKGVEIKAAEGASVRSVDAGKVVYTGWIKNLGNLCIISHGKHYYTVYGRLSSITKSKNDEVKQGEVIGKVGSEASFFDFPTLYFEIREGDRPLNPENWLR